jgi:hypothetical protein
MKKFEVGEVVYLLNQKSLNIIPGMIVEEIVRKTMDESITEFMIELPDNKKTRAKMSDISSLIFNDIPELRNHMIENTKQSIEKMIQSAIEIQNIKFSNSSEEKNIDKEILEEKEKIVQKDKKDDIIEK